MEPLPDQTTNGRGEHSLPPHGNKVQRMSGHARGIVGDVQAWIDLKFKLTQLQIERKIERRLNRLAVSVIVALFSAMAGFFALVTAALGLGAWLGHPAWGFLIVTVLLFLIAGIVQASRPRLVRMAHKRAEVDDSELSSSPPTTGRASATSNNTGSRK